MVKKKIELTEVQKGIYFDCQIDNPTAYNISATIQLEHVDEKAFEHALQLVVSEQEALRCSITMDDDLPVFCIHESVNFPLGIEDYRDREENIISFNRRVEEIISEPFDLEIAPLFRGHLLKLHGNKQLFILCIHHIIADGLSLEIIKKQVLEYYSRLKKGQPIRLQDNSTFSSFIQQENERLTEGYYDEQKKYWMDKMKGAEALALGSDYTITHKREGIGLEKRIEIPEQLYKKIEEMAMEQEVTLFMFFLSAFSILMNEYTHQEDLVISSPFSYRMNSDLEDTVGCFVYMLPLRIRLSSEESFAEVLQKMYKELMYTYKNTGYPNNLIMRDSSLVPMLGSPSIFDVSFVYDVYEETMEHHMATELMDQEAVTFPGNLMVVLNKTPDKNQLKLQYKADIFSEDTMELMGRRFLQLLETVVDNVSMPLEQLPWLLEGEEEKIIDTFNTTGFYDYQPQHIIEVFHDKVNKHPERIALIEEDRTETYASVNHKANQLAHKILAKKTRDEEVIAVSLERSTDLMISLLGILKAGCAYLPLDPSYPNNRKDYILEDAQVALVITSKDLAYDTSWKVDTLYIEDEALFAGQEPTPDIEPNPYSLAYIMYTSGSTGQPKGVMIENHSVVNTLLDLERRFPLEAKDVFLLKTAFSFDVSVTELFGWFMGEGALYILPPGEEKNPEFILEEISHRGITHINFVPSMFRLFLEALEDTPNLKKLKGLKWLFVGGEAMTSEILQRYKKLNMSASIENVYGPTECTIWASHCSLNNHKETMPITIGQPLNETRWYVVGHKDKLQPIGIQGELCLSGAGLARGYLNREALNKERFVPNPFYREGVDPEHFRMMYRTGDLAKWTPQGDMAFLGRMDFQVKVRGVRLELGEIENALEKHPKIVQAVVVVKKQRAKPDTLCAYYQGEDELTNKELREYLMTSLPTYMIPSFFVHRASLPKNTSGKINRKVLIQDTDYLHYQSMEYIAPASAIEHTIADIWKEVLAIAQVGLDDNFFETGGHSLALIQVYNKLKKVVLQDFPMTLLFQMPTVRLLADYLTKDQQEKIEDRQAYFKKEALLTERDIAIIGIAVRVPGATNIQDFWQNLKNEKETIHYYEDEELSALGISQEVLSDSHYVKAKGRIDGIDYFDGAFFDYTPAELQMMSPQLRLLYKGTWEALEDAGYYPSSTPGKIGVFMGASDDFEWYKKLLFGEEPFSDIYQLFTLSTNHFLASRLAYKLNIKGPVFSALTGCSTTLVTPHLACQSLLMGECSLAVAGGITIELPNEGGYFYEEGMMFSPDGHCRPFDAKARGTVFSNGMGVVVLKRLQEAMDDGDHIYAVIKGSAINNDGNQKVSFAAPSIDGQAEVIQEAYRVAGIDPETVSYVEAHGTGTSLGDPIEVDSLTQAFATSKKQFCVLGSVKGNIGHTDTAAGIVGLAKVALSLKHRYLPGTVNYTSPNPKIDFEGTPFKISSHGIPWQPLKDGEKLRAGINSFGVGGTNAHMVLEEPPLAPPSSEEESINLMVFSGKTPKGVKQTAERMVQYCVDNPDLNLSDVAWTLQTGREAFPYRQSVVLDRSSLTDGELLDKIEQGKVVEASGSQGQVFFMFSGQGSQYQGMGRDLYHGTDSTLGRLFNKHIQQAMCYMTEDERKELLDLLYGYEHGEKITQTQYAQVAIFVTEYALAQCFMALGINPTALVGHSIGEVTAAAVASVFSIEDGVAIVRARGRIMQEQEHGSMLAVMADAQVIEEKLIDKTWIALNNTTNKCVIAGHQEAIGTMEARLKSLGISYAPVRTSHAFHTPMMQPAAEAFEAFLAQYTLHEPKIPIVSNVSGTWVEEGQMTHPHYWAEHILRPVQFARILQELLKHPKGIFLEVGPGRTLCSFASQHQMKHEDQTFVNTLRHPKEQVNDLTYIYQRIGAIWGAGVPVDWHALKGNVNRNRLSLPCYVYDEQYYPIQIDQKVIGSVPVSTMAEAAVTGEVILQVAGLDNIEEAVIEGYKTVFGFNSISLDDQFFDLGGDSLKAVSLSAILKRLLHIKLSISDLFEQTSPRALAKYIEDQGIIATPSATIMPAEPKDYYPLTSSQKRMYTLYMLDKASIAYNLPSATVIEGELDRKQFDQALEGMINYHESLRTSFDIVDNEPVQIIAPKVRLPLHYSEYLGATKADISNIIEEFVEPFVLEEAPLVRVGLVKIAPKKHLLLFDVHHIIADGTSVEIMTRDFNKLYFGQLQSPGIQYKDFAVWQKKYLASEAIEKERAFWLDQLGGTRPTLTLPTDYERPAVKSFGGGRVYFTLDEALSKSLMNLAQDTESTMYMVILSMWYILLAKYTNQQDIIVGTPIAGRSLDEIRETVGMFVNMLPMRQYPQSDSSYTTFLQQVKKQVLEAFKHPNYPFDQLVEELQVSRDLNRNALFDVCFDYQNMELHDLQVGNMTFKSYEFDTHTATYDLVLTCQENSENHCIGGFLEYSTALFKEETVHRILDHLQGIMKMVLEKRDVLLSDISLLTEKELRLIESFNSKTYRKRDEQTVVKAFEAQVEMHPDKIALITADDRKLTYEALNQSANRLAWKLKALGIGRGTLVGLMPERDEYLFIALLGILKAGAAYVPLDHGFPRERIEHMISQCNLDYILSPKIYHQELEGVGHLINPCIADTEKVCDNLNLDTKPNDLAYVLFTSGSTGLPKGAMINHESLNNFVEDIRERELFAHEDDRIICVTTVCFDIFGFESIVPLCTGHSIYLANEQEQLDPALAGVKMEAYGVTHILSTVSRIKAFVGNRGFGKALEGLKCILSGGENYPKALLEELQKHSSAKLYNMYGPTETTIWSTTKDITHAQHINIGEPIANTQIYILDENRQLQPIGIWGEIAIGGAGVACGYMHNQEETHSKFIELEGIEGRIYLTGDRGRLLSHGEVEISGRLDSQVKIRGYRIELSDIEKIALSHDGIGEAVVLPIEDAQGNGHLTLYYCRKGTNSLEKETVKGWLQERLPHYMIPSYYILLDEMPKLPNGKINKKALEPPMLKEESDKTQIKRSVITATNSIEETILNIWQEVLDTPSISIRDNFFDLGGNSLGLMLVNNQLNELLDTSIPLVQLFEHPTIESLASSLNLEVEEKEQTHVPESSLEPVAEKISRDIAVIGMSCYFPEAEDTDTFWQNLYSGRESINTFTDEELRASGVSDDLIHHPRYVKNKGYLEGVEYFDHGFFDYAYQESNKMDPQIRVMHQCIWKAIEHAGYDTSRYDGRIGLFAGSGSNVPWMMRYMGYQHDLINAFEAMTLNEKDFLTTRISYKLDLKGPSFNVQTACSTSLVAIHQAVESLIRHEADMAVAAGVTISYPRKEGYLWHEGMIFSRDGHCRPFSDDASGTVAGNGCGAVLLKPLDQAIKDRDTIYAVVKGSAINNDGLHKIGYTAPSIAGQKYVIEEALAKSGVEAEDITYIEAHGTGTTLGDPIEIEALKQGFDVKEKTGYCAIGSVKANIGHLDAAAGVAGFIKTVLALYHRTIPPMINFNAINSRIELDASPFYINQEPKEVSGSQVMRAGVSAFGIGGTNVHMVLEEPPVHKQSSKEETYNLMVFSGKTPTAVEETSRAILQYLAENPQINYSDGAYTLQVGRQPMTYRRTVVLSKEEIQQKKVEEIISNSELYQASEERKSIVFLFPDVSSYYQGMGQKLFKTLSKSKITKIYRRHVHMVCSCLNEEEANQLMNALYGQQPVKNPSYYKALAVFTTSYALGRTLIDLGIEPTGVYGQGVGEISALAIAGKLHIDDAIEGLQDRDIQISCLQIRDNEPVLKGTGYSILSREDIHDTNTLLLLDMGWKGLDDDKEAVTGNRQQQIISLLHDAHDTVDDLAYFYEGLGKLWCHGIRIDWEHLKGREVRARIPLPTYVFDKIYHDHDVILGSANESMMQADHGVEGQEDNKQSKVTVEEALQDIWKSTLGCQEVNDQDDFFAMGGHSLTAIALAADILKSFGVDIPLTEVFNNASFGEMKAYIEKHQASCDHEGITPLKKQPYYEVSSAQKRMYSVQSMTEESIAYNLNVVYKIKGSLDKERLTYVFDTLVERHEALRTRFVIVDGELVQVIEEKVESPVTCTAVKEEQIQKEIEVFLRPFDLSKAPLLRVKCLSINSDEHILLIDMPHIISDQSSIAILLEEFITLYKGEKLPPLAIQYKDFAHWQNQRIEGGAIEEQMTYWKQELSGSLPTLDMITDYARTADRESTAKVISLAFHEPLNEAINTMASELGVTAYMMIAAALKLVLWKSTGQKDMIIGTGIAGRRHTDLKAIVGMFVNTLAIRSQIDDTLTMEEYVHYIKDKMVQAFDHQDCQFDHLLEQLDYRRDTLDNPLFDVMLNYINMGTEELTIEGLELEPWQPPELHAKFDLTFTIEETNGKYFTSLEYATGLYTREHAKSLLNRLVHVLSHMTANPQCVLKQIPMVNQQERQWLVETLNDTRTNLPLDKTIMDIFHEQVEQQGEHLAIEWQGDSISYRSLLHKVNQLASKLQDYGIRRGDRVGILLSRSPIQVISLLAIMQCGATYVPFDPDYPMKRMNFMLEDSECGLVITSEAHREMIESLAPIMVVKDGWSVEDTVESIPQTVTNEGNRSTDTVYIMYTSGSTGIPKGVLINHKNILRVVKETNYIQIEPSDRILQLSNYAFDGSIFGIFGALLNGATLVLAEKEVVREMGQLCSFIKKEAINVFFMTTALFNALVDWDVSALKGLRQVMVGGEKLSIKHMKKAVDAYGQERFMNIYGPTETTVFAVYHPIDTIDTNIAHMPIGRPLSNTSLYILDEYGQLLPPYFPGELYIGGVGVGDGYLNRDDLTKSRFLHMPYLEEGRIYRTGDRVYYNAKGEVVYLDRLDNQIKLRGNRVELGEIESEIKQIMGIQDAIAVAREDQTGSYYIAAYYVPDIAQKASAQLTPEAIGQMLHQQLPGYMVPSRIKALDSLPLTLNGKVDRKALPIIQETNRVIADMIEPRNTGEKILLERMREVLDAPYIGVRDNFFHHGGQSIKAITYVQALSKDNISIKVSDLFKHPTVEELATLPSIGAIHPNRKEQERDEVEEGVLHLTDEPIHKLVDAIELMNGSLSYLITACERQSSFPLSPVQKAQQIFNSSISGFTYEFHGELTQQQLQEILWHIIANNQLLHSTIEYGDEPKWHEYDCSTIRPLMTSSLPYLDIRSYTEDTQKVIIQKLCQRLLLSEYGKGKLPWRLCCVRTAYDQHVLIWGFDHIAFDGMSSEILKSQMEEAMEICHKQDADLTTGGMELPTKYEAYTAYITQGPTVEEEDIIDKFSLDAWCEHCSHLTEKLCTISDRSQKQIAIHLPLDNKSNQDLWITAYSYVNRLLSQYLDMSTVPLALVSYGRQYEERDYYHCVGEFLDLIPIGTGDEEHMTPITELLAYCQENRLHFLSLLFDHELAHKHQKIMKLLEKAYCSKDKPQQMAIYNFQGFIQEKEKEAFGEMVSEDALSQLLITVNYDEKQLHILLACEDGLNPEKIEGIRRSICL